MRVSSRDDKQEQNAVLSETPEHPHSMRGGWAEILRGESGCVGRAMNCKHTWREPIEEA